MVVSIADKPIDCGFVVLVDSGEGFPFNFSNIRADADRSCRPLTIPTVWRSLGAANGDYSIDGFEPKGRESGWSAGCKECGNRRNVDNRPSVSIERKSLDDAHATFLGWDERRERFLRELENFSTLTMRAVIVESSLEILLRLAPEHGKKTASQNRKTLYRSILSWQCSYPVPWFFCDSRRLAEITCFRLLERFWRKYGKPYAREQRRIEREQAGQEGLLAAMSDDPTGVSGG